jgi:hypothetical protein
MSSSRKVEQWYVPAWDKPYPIPRDPATGMPLIQTFEREVATELPIIGPFLNVEANAKELAEA